MRVLRYEIPVDGDWHELQMSGPLIHVDTRRADLVEAWVIETDRPTHPRRFQVFGTGQPLPGHVVHVGSAITAGGRLVWHLFEDNLSAELAL